MVRKGFIFAAAFVGVLALAFAFTPARAGIPSSGNYKVLAPISHGNLTIFPVVADETYDTSGFITLDDGIRTGQVVVTESGNVAGLVRRRDGRPIPVRSDGAQVNQLVLVNNSSKPLLLLAGEIVTGGKQDRVIGKDRIIPSESDPVDLSVFCVEPGRWTARTTSFGTMKSQMAQPSVRAKAMGAKDQGQVWAEVRKQQAAASTEVVAAAPEINTTTSYAQVMENKAVQEKVDDIAKPIEQDYRGLIRQLRDRHAVGVVVAVNGELIWADVFASTSLLEKYWPKLVRSYAAEAFGQRGKFKKLDVSDAQAFLDDRTGRRESVESEPGVFRHTEVTGDGFKVFELTSLLPKTNFDLHVAKMAE